MPSRKLKGSAVKRAAVLATLLGALAFSVSLALASSAPPAPRFASHPAHITARSTATFRLRDSQGHVTFLCARDGAKFSRCAARTTFRRLRAGAHRFRARAVDPSRHVSSVASFAWTVDHSAPSLAVTFPADHSHLNAASFAAGCSSGAGVCGSALEPAGVRSVSISIQSAAGGYWRGTSYGSHSAVYLRAALTRRRGGANWFYKLGAPPAGSYTVRVIATDKVGNKTGARSILSSAFTIDAMTTPPPATGRALPFVIAGETASLLYPAGPVVPIVLTLTNPNTSPIVVTDLSARVASAAASGCQTDWYAVTQASLPSAGITIPAGGSVTLPAQGATNPTIQMLDAGVNQDTCQAALLTLSYTGSAHS
jgi:hypothetical protein